MCVCVCEGCHLETRLQRALRLRVAPYQSKDLYNAPHLTTHHLTLWLNRLGLPYAIHIILKLDASR